jgi:hypothetical protein
MRAETDDDNDFVDPYLVFHVVDAPQPPDAEDGEVVKRRDSHSHGVEVVQQDKNNLLRVHRFGV